MGPVHLVAVVPTYTIADGEYDHIAAGHLAALGFALQVATSAPAGPDGPGVVQDDALIPTTTITGTVLRPTDQAPAVLDDGSVRPLLATSDDPWTAGEMLAVTGRLAVEPYLWATDGMLWPLVPDGVRMWSVHAIRRLGEDGVEHLPSLPGPTGLDHDATYVLDLAMSP